ncbi:MAG TPA: 2-phosphosulfolactate phosphatase, partial [Planctomycetota bacterium]|nr:2-phosphosulfolactate phosphatase [Planctomycetota bacterium]
MRVDVALSTEAVAAVPGGASGRHAVVIDVLRATSTIVSALAAGARAIYPVANPEE